MKKSLLILVGLVCFGGLVACSGGEDDSKPAPIASGADNPAVGAPVGAGSGPGVGEPAPEEGAPTGSKPPPPGRRGEKK
ncbi:MAG: hypothetical protein ACKVQS_11890 [Fimbriimonadaceae bacterium]